jgi:hypothetical protein
MKTFIAKRSPFSTEDAIRKISSRWGLAKVIEIGKDHIVEEHVNFQYKKPSLKKMAQLLKEIHSETNISGVNLVHGDFSFQNVTILDGDIKCFDYEHSHFGNPYADIGRIILRGCGNILEALNFFGEYSGSVPEPEILREGLIYFCDWQNLLRETKGLPFAEVPLLRKEKIEKATNCLENILYSFGSEVKL